MTNIFETLMQRGYIEQSSGMEEISALLSDKPISFYIGFDPTADSLHVGHFVQIMVMSHLQKAGHRPIVLIGGGTAMIGDPSGRTDMRKMLTPEQLKANTNAFRRQLSRFISFSGDNAAILVNNADWLADLKYLEFIRDYGRFFSVNRMLTAECFKSRLEKGLTFLEFNYMLMQSYDYLELNRQYNVTLQIGGNDQWSNMLAGADLIRRLNVQPVHALTIKLLTTSAGKKMGKTENGAVWLDAAKTTPYNFYQYWRNINDNDIKNCLSLLTFLPLEEVNKLTSLPNEEINEAKKALAFEVTSLVHGEQEAFKAREASETLFGKGSVSDDLPTLSLLDSEVSAGINIIPVLIKCGLISSNSEGRRLIAEGGIYLNGSRIDGHTYILTKKDFPDNNAMLRKGKKVYFKLTIES